MLLPEPYSVSTDAAKSFHCLENRETGARHHLQNTTEAGEMDRGSRSDKWYPALSCRSPWAQSTDVLTAVC